MHCSYIFSKMHIHCCTHTHTRTHGYIYINIYIYTHIYIIIHMYVYIFIDAYIILHSSCNKWFCTPPSLLLCARIEGCGRSPNGNHGLTYQCKLRPSLECNSLCRNKIQRAIIIIIIIIILTGRIWNPHSKTWPLTI